MKLIALILLCLTACKVYDVHVKLTPAAEDRRLASGKSDTIKGRLERADAGNLYVRVDGEVQTIPRADVVRVDQRLAKRDVKAGIVATVVGAALMIGGVVAFDCGKNDFPLFCALGSKQNLYAAVAFLGGFALGAGGVGYWVNGASAQSDVDAMLRRSASRWHLGPTIVRGEPGIGLGVRF